MATTRLYTFIDLFTTNDEENKLPLQKIEIPIIQRDYAQGRQTDDVNRIRERFLTSLYDALTLDKQIKLDFPPIPMLQWAGVWKQAFFCA